MKKTILVTGSNKGIGFEIVRQLAKLGHNVILTARDEEKGENAVLSLKNEGLHVYFMQLQVTDDEQIATAVQQVSKQFGKLDVLINNAAIMDRADKNLLVTSDELFRLAIETNAIAPLKITKAFVPIMPAGSSVIMMSSGGGSMTDTVGGWCPAYCISKSMLNAETRHLSYYLGPKQISVNAMCPGWVQTDMGGQGAPRTVQQGADTAVWLVAEAPQSITGKFLRDRKEIPW